MTDDCFSESRTTTVAMCVLSVVFVAIGVTTWMSQDSWGAGMPFFVMGVTFGIIGFMDTDDDEDDARDSPS